MTHNYVQAFEFSKKEFQLRCYKTPPPKQQQQHP